MDLFWRKDSTFQAWTLETDRQHVIGEVDKRGGQYIAGVVIPYHIDENGEERDWQPAPRPFKFLHEATAWVEENAHWSTQGEFIFSKNIKIAA